MTHRLRLLETAIRIIAEAPGWEYHLCRPIRNAGQPPGFADIVMTNGRHIVFAYAIDDRTQLDHPQRRWILALMACHVSRVRSEAIGWCCDDDYVRTELRAALSRGAMCYYSGDCPDVQYEDGNYRACPNIRASSTFPELLIVEPPVLTVVSSPNMSRKCQHWLDAASQRPAISVVVWQPRDMNKLKRLLAHGQ